MSHATSTRLRRRTVLGIVQRPLVLRVVQCLTRGGRTIHLWLRDVTSTVLQPGNRTTGLGPSAAEFENLPFRRLDTLAVLNNCLC
jgi:hypothetical protein